MRKKRVISRSRLTAILITTLLIIGHGLGAQAGGVPGPDVDGAVTPNSHDDPNPQSAAYVPHQVVMRLHSGDWALYALEHELVTDITATLDHLPVYLVSVDPEVDERRAADDLGNLPGVMYAHPNYLLNWAHSIQGSYPFSDNDFVGDMATQFAVEMLNLSGAHEIATGSGVVVGILDGGAEFSHSWLGGAALSGYDFVDDDGNAFDEPGGHASGHGTFVAGIVHLTAPDATIRAYRVMAPDGCGDGFTVAQALESAVDEGCHVINLSLALASRHLAVRDAIEYAATEGVSVVAGAGNEGSDEPVYPAAEADAIAVAAVDSALLAPEFTSHGDHIDVCAPGVDVYSAYQGPYFAWWSGTSFSAPFVSALAALLKENDPTANWLHIRNTIISTAQNVDLQNPELAGLLGAGLIDPVMSLTTSVISDTAAVIPDTLCFTHFEGAQYLIVPFGFVMLMSTNAPAPYTSVVDTDGVFTFVVDDVGLTGDSVEIQVDPWAMPVGTHYNTVWFYVDGVTDPAVLTVRLDVFESGDTTETATLNPSTLWFQSEPYVEVPLFGTSLLWSSNAPAAYTAELLEGGDQFSVPVDSAGMTIDSVTVMVDPSLMPGAGFYVDTIVYHVQDVPYPAVLVVYLELTDSSGTGDSAWVVQDSGGIFFIEEGSPTAINSCMGVYSSNAPADFFVEFAGTPVFTTLFDSTGVTNGMVCFQVAATGLTAGTYVDTLLITVDDVINNPVSALLTLIVTPAGGGDDTAFVVPNQQFFYAVEASDEIQYGSVLVGATGSPKPYLVGYLDPPDFTYLSDSSGVTNDSVDFEINHALLTPGLYVDTLIFFVEDVTNSPLISVNYLTVDSSGGGGDSAFVMPHQQFFYAIEASGEIQYGNVLAGATGSPKPYAVGYLDPPDFTYLFDSSGVTNDSVDFEINHALLTPGFYVDTLIFFVEDVTNSPLISVNYLTVDSSGGGETDSAVVIPDSLHFSVPHPLNDTIMDHVVLISSNAPALFSAFVLGGPGSFVFLPDSVGTTNDSVWIGVVTSGLSEGMYTDSVVFDVDGVIDPVLLFVLLTVGDSVMVTVLQNYPNPFNPSTEIVFSIREAAHVSLKVYNSLGQEVNTLLEDQLPAGPHRVTWEGRDRDGRQVASGVYFYRLQTAREVVTRKMLLLK